LSILSKCRRRQAGEVVGAVVILPENAAMAGKGYSGGPAA